MTDIEGDEKIKITLIFFVTIAIILSVLSAYVAINLEQTKQTDSWGAVIRVDELSEKPQAYFLLENPDSYVLEAILNPGKSVFLRFWNNTQIDEMVESYGTNNIEYDGHYYSVEMLYVDPAPAISEEVVLVLFMVWVLFGLSVIIVTVYSRKSSYFKNKKQLVSYLCCENAYKIKRLPKRKLIAFCSPYYYGLTVATL